MLICSDSSSVFSCLQYRWHFVGCPSIYVCLMIFLFLIYLFMAVLGLRFFARALPSCGKRGPPFITVRGPLTIAASLVAEHKLQARRLSNCGPRAQPLRGMWDHPKPGPEPVSPALAGRLNHCATRKALSDDSLCLGSG